MALAGVIVLCVLVAANFAWSLRLAYSMALNANGGGYPILGHAVHNFFMLAFALFLLPKIGAVPLAIRVPFILAFILVPVVNVWLIIRFGRRGEHQHAAAKGRPMAMPAAKTFSVKCKECGSDNVFDQPYPYHAGFSDQGFLYSDSGHLTLIWSLYDPALKRFFPAGSRWDRDAELREQFEQALQPAPDGGRWRAENPARCIHCSAPIGGSSLQTIYYLVYPGSLQTQTPGGAMKLGKYMKDKT